MVRHKEFDPDEAVADAMALFWERGYEATSVQDLVERTGVGRRSMYDTFGDKHSLYLRALDRYIGMTEDGFRRSAASAADGLSAIRALFAAILESDDKDLRGCLIVNSSTELGPTDDDAAERLRRHLDVSREALDAQVRRGQRDGSVTDRIDPGTLTAVAFNAWLGIRVAVRARTPRDQIIHDVEQLLSLLSGSRT
ncbi:TetR/AcrR family transcriptional regulator [Kutzneria kofuensis]|uniref:TetR/AcrR family transcriptional repressor of nem operon n=1 Tax=Kutzneria kofuensis TaxID=103725 RepID=A0A7W9KNN3_9PSEU|nr:TetR/AcrR family transcriptional regulator [Kutzneria kofuensis]MBB5895891.1 TetR/AcrR family transcriptional repressor of nem operon [Kutzneria kofuensis]